MHRLLLLTFFLTGSLFLQAQRFGGHPPSTRWKQINTDTVRVIFPEGYEQKAADIASITHQLGLLTQPTIGARMSKISIVLQPNTVISNAYVSLAPRRSEFQLMPSQNSFELGSIPWYRFLAMHEYRHVQQYNNFKKGLSRIAFYLFGEDGEELANNAAIPNWFWEGDAVYQETRMTGQGRGRLPFFFNDYRSLWMAHKDYSWQKLRSGSLRDFTPDHYRLGYMMVSYGREKYGDDFWRKVTDDAARYKGLFYPWQHAVKKYSGISYQEYRKNAMKYFHAYLPADNKTDAAAVWAAQQKHFVADDEFPQWVDDHTIVMVKSSYRTIPAFYKHDLNTGADTRIRVRDISIDNYFSYRNGKIVYAAYVPDTRWTWADYSVLKLLDLETGSEKTLSTRSKYFSPDISADGKIIVAVNVQPASDAKLDILSSESGELVKELPNPTHLFYTYPKFYDNNTIVSAVRNANGAMTLGLISTNDGSMEELLPWSMNVIGFPAVRGDTITFTASHNGNDLLFAMIDKKLYRLQSVDTGLINGKYQWSIRNNRAVWTAFTAVGYHLMQEQVSSTSFIPVTTEYFTSTPFTYNLPDLQAARNIPVNTGSYPVTKYSQSFRLPNFHSWHPFINDPDYTFSLLGENVLNTLQSEIFFNYNKNEQSKQVGANFTYAALFPYITLGTNYTIDRNAIYRNTTVFWNEWQSSAGLAIPLNLSKGRTSTSLTLSSNLVYNKRYFQGLFKDTFDSRGFTYLSSQISFANQSQQARLHIYPRWAQTITLRYSNAVSLFTANQFLVSAYWYFPGLGLTNNLIFNTAFQQRDTLNNARFSNSFPFSRGYIGENFHRMTKVGVNYHLPLLYPDEGIANIVYFLRVRANMFYDYTHVFDFTFPSRNEYRDEFRSYGVELFFDTQWWNEYPVSFGIRYSRLVDGQKQGLAPDQWEFILPMNLFSR